MAQTVFAGKDGSVIIPGTPNVAVAKLTNWTLTLQADNLEVTSLGDQWKSFIRGVAEWNGKLSGYFIADEDASQGAVMSALLTGTSLVLQLQEGQGRGYFEGQVNVTQQNVGNDVKNAQTVDWTFVGNGVLNHLP